MFIEFETTKDELVSLNISCIKYVLETKKGCTIFDLDCMEFYVAEDYAAFVERLNNLTSIERMNSKTLQNA